MTRRLKPEFRTNVFKIGITMAIIVWTSIAINIFMLDCNSTIGWINTVMGLMVVSFFVGASIQLIDNIKDTKRMFHIYIKTTAKLMMNMHKACKEHYEKK